VPYPGLDADPGTGGTGGTGTGGTSGTGGPSDGGSDPAIAVDARPLDTTLADVSPPPPDQAINPDLAVDAPLAPDTAPPDRMPDAMTPDLPPPDAAIVYDNGLWAEYYSDTNFVNLVFAQTDQVISNPWGHEKADPRMPSAENFAVRWTGEIWARYSQLYTFHFAHDDGVRLWINDEPIVDMWNMTGTDTKGTYPMVAGQRYRIKIEYCDRTLTATIRFYWSSVSQLKEIVPFTRLFHQRR
jgi:hypothetical protein